MTKNVNNQSYNSNLSNNMSSNSQSKNKMRSDFLLYNSEELCNNFL